MSSISTKIYIRPGQQVRRTVVHPDTSLEDFKRQVIQAYESSPLFVPREYDVQLQYYDEEGDWICANSEQEWKEGIRLYEVSAKELFRVKFTLLAKTQQQRPTTSTSDDRSHIREHPFRCFGRLRGLRHGSRPYWMKEEKDTSPSTEQQESADQINNLLSSLFSTVFGPPQSEEKRYEYENKKDSSTEAHSNESENRGYHQPQNEISTISQPAYSEIGDISVLVQEDDVPTETYTPHPSVSNNEEIHQEEKDCQPQHMDPIEEQAKEQYHDALITLETMGFTNKALNHHLCSHFKGDIPKIVSSLLEISH